MKHLFIINPVAGGKKTDHEAIKARVRSVMDENGGDYEIYVTKAPMDACDKIREEAKRGEDLQVYACGGDGTLNECINGAANLDNVAVTHYPCGTGNDFVRMFGEEGKRFFDLRQLLAGEVIPTDIMVINGHRYAVNICSVGIDARIGTDVHKYSGLPIIGGAGGYVISLVVNLFKGINSNLRIRTEDKTYNGSFALVVACNGRFYGGGFNPVPEARPDDGIIDTLVVKHTTIASFMKMILKYAKGKYREFTGLIEHHQGKLLEVESDSELVINVDGELLRDKRMSLRIIEGGVKFLYPENMAFFANRNKRSTVN